MRIVAIDDEPLALKGVENAILRVNPTAEFEAFEDTDAFMEKIKKDGADVALIDIEMYDEDGIKIAKKAKAINPDINVIFVTGHSSYMAEAFQLHASGYILKPITPEKMKYELDNLRRPELSGSETKIRFITFGDFEVLFNNEIVDFNYNKTKELLAVLVDKKGGFCSNEYLCELLWEGDSVNSHKSYLRNLISDLTQTFKNLGCENVIIKRRGMACINRALVSCDYYDYLDGIPSGVNSFKGEYMSQYSWGEETLGELMFID
ncbi:MAG: response regulator [Lachnospiraceae bacterium]|nr:response regulator [Lachnospiraceae bacterium]